jgi:hypothetical protein
MTTRAHGILVRASLGLRPNASDEEVAAACTGRTTAEVCDAVSCHCVTLLADGTPGLTPDVSLAMLSAHEVVAKSPPPGCSDAACCQTGGNRLGGVDTSLAMFSHLDAHQRRAIKDKK